MTMRTMGGPGASSDLAAGAYAPWSAGRTYTVPSASGSTAWATQNFLGNYTWFVPVAVPNACYINSVSMYFFSTVATNGFYSLYNDNPKMTSFGPATRLWQSNLVSVVVNSSPVIVTQAVGLAVTYPQLLWFSFNFNATITSSVTVNQSSFVPTSKLSNAQLVTCLLSGSTGVGQPADASSVVTSVIAGNSPLVFFAVT